jgi:hypothetical protein
MTIDDFLDLVDWDGFERNGMQIRKRTRLANGYTCWMCPLQDVFGRADYLQKGRSVQLPVSLIMEAADTGDRNSWSLRKRMLRRMGEIK